MTTEMSDNETVDDVLADMLLPRFDAITAMRANNYDEIKSLVANYRDRIKAAYKREVDKLNSVIQAQRSAFDAEQDRQRRAAPGDAAAMREALETLLNLAYEVQDANSECGPKTSVPAQFVIDVAKSAIAAPPRNCDRFADELDAQLAFLNEVWLISIDRETMTEQDTYENWTDEMRTRYGRWLLAPATEQKGEDNGK